LLCLLLSMHFADQLSLVCRLLLQSWSLTRIARPSLNTNWNPRELMPTKANTLRSLWQWNLKSRDWFISIKKYKPFDFLYFLVVKVLFVHIILGLCWTVKLFLFPFLLNTLGFRLFYIKFTLISCTLTYGYIKLKKILFLIYM